MPLAQVTCENGPRRDELAGDPIEHVVEPVLVRLHDHFARAAVDREVGQHQVLHAVEVPDVARHDLVVPLQLAGVDIDREDRADVEIVLVASTMRSCCGHGSALPVPT